MERDDIDPSMWCMELVILTFALNQVECIKISWFAL